MNYNNNYNNIIYCEILYYPTCILYVMDSIYRIILYLCQKCHTHKWKLMMSLSKIIGNASIKYCL